MTVDRTHVLATPGMDAHGSYVALSLHRDGMELHYGHDDFANQDRLTRTLSRGRAKDMASDYQSDPVESYAERRGITYRARVAEIVHKVVPERLRGMFDGLRLPTNTASGPEGGQRPERESAGMEARHAAAAPTRETAEDREVRTKALIRPARAVDAIGRAFPAALIGGDITARYWVLGRRS